MSRLFSEDIQEFFRRSNMNEHNPAVVRAAAHFADDVKVLCSDAEHLVRHPNMIRMCCPPMRRLPRDASPQLKAAFDEHVDLCFRANAGWRSDRPVKEAHTQRVAFETRRRQKVVDIVAGEACKNSEFARAHADVCCRSPGLHLGFAEDNQAVARACGLAQM